MALLAVEDSGPLDRLLPVPSPEHRRMSLLFSRVHYFNHNYRKANDYLSGLLPLYEDIRVDTDYVFIRSQLLLMEGHTEEALKILGSSLSDTRSREDKFFLRFCLGKAHFWNGDYLNANLLFQTTEQHYSMTGNPLMLGNIRYMLGYTAFQRCFFDQAGSFYRKAVENFRDAGSSRQLAAVFHMIGILSYRTGHYEESENYLSQSSRFFKNVKNTAGITETTIALGRVKMFLGDHQSAREYMNKARELAEKTGYKRGHALALEFLGEIAFLEEHYDLSMSYLLRAEELALEIAPKGDITVEVYRRLGDLYTRVERLEEAESILTKALELSKSLHDDHELGCVLRALGILEAKKSNIELSHSYFGESISTMKTIKEPFELARTYLSAAEIFTGLVIDPEPGRDRKSELLDSARTSATEAAHLYDSLGLPDKAEKCENLANRILSDFYEEKNFSRKVRVVFKDSWLYEGFVVARSDHMKKVVSKIASLSPSNIPILISGDTGTGKEVIAKLIHKLSMRPDGKFVAFNCASIPDSVFESELFGHRKGAFTGADRNHVGLIERASGGTLFLDEISDLTVSQQAKLLRVFQEQKIRRIGESGERHIDIRIISASNQNIDALLRSGKLRKDFYYRILTDSIKLEPLRRRRKDILALFAWYIKQSGFDPAIEEGVLEFLNGYHWPGNVRQLISVVRVLSLIGREKGTISKGDLPLKIRNHHILGLQHDPLTSANILKTREIRSIGLIRDRDEIRDLIVSSLIRTNGNKSSAARELGISRSTMYRMLKNLAIK